MLSGKKRKLNMKTDEELLDELLNAYLGHWNFICAGEYSSKEDSDRYWKLRSEFLYGLCQC